MRSQYHEGAIVLPEAYERDLLARSKQDEILKSISVVMPSTCNHLKDIRGCYKSDTNEYLVKSIEAAKFKRTIPILMEH